MVHGAARSLGLQAVARDMGWSLPITTYVGSSAAKSMAARTCLGKVRHLEVECLWL
jgi:hypothetical protein